MSKRLCKAISGIASLGMALSGICTSYYAECETEYYNTNTGKRYGMSKKQHDKMIKKKKTAKASRRRGRK